MPLAAMLDPTSASGVFDEDAAHGLGGEKMTAAVPMLSLVHIDEAQVCLMDEGGGFERLSRLFLGELPCCESAQFVVDQWQKLRRGRWVAFLDRGQNVRNLGHGTEAGRKNNFYKSNRNYSNCKSCINRACFESAQAGVRDNSGRAVPRNGPLYAGRPLARPVELC
jgi:hypothetical protein